MEGWLVELGFRLLDLRKRLDGFREDLEAKWATLDAMQRETLLLASLYLAFALTDLGVELAKSRIHPLEAQR